MKETIIKMLPVFALAILLQGCVAVPPVIQVQDKDDKSDIMRRLDEIDKRLDRLESKLAK